MMKPQSHPKHKEWQSALDAMVEEETRYFAFATEDHTQQEIQTALMDLHKARQAFWDIADKLIVIRSNSQEG
jgi:hypothetical protein